MITTQRVLCIAGFFFVFIAIPVFGAELFDQDFFDNEGFTIHGINHSLRFYPSNGKVSLRAGEAVLILSVGDCKTQGILEYCIDAANTTEIDDKEGYRVIGKTSVRVTELGPSISADVTTDKSIVGVNEPATLTIALENRGKDRASDLEIRAKVPSQASIVGESTGMTSLGSQAVWKGSLLPNEKKTLKFTTKALRYTNFNVTFEGSFAYAGKVQALAMSPLRVKVITPVQVDSGISQESVILNEESTYWVNITNIDKTSSLDVSELNILVPTQLVITEKSQEFKEKDYEENHNKLTAAVAVSKGETKSFFVKIKTMEKGAYNISSTLKSVIHETAFTDSSAALLRVGLADIIPSITIMPDKAVGGDTATIVITLKNAGSRDISAYTLDVTSNLIGAIQQVNQSLNANGARTIFSKSVKLPDVSRETIYFFRLSGSHKNLAGSPLQFDTQKNVIVLPKETLIEVIPGIVVEGKNVKVKVRLRSLKEKLTDVSIVDVVPKGMSTTGMRYADLELLEPGEEREALNYTILLPSTFAQKTLGIQQSLSAKQENGKIYSMEKEVTIDLLDLLKPPELNVSSESLPKETAKNESQNGSQAAQVNPLRVPPQSSSASNAVVNVFITIWQGVKEFFIGLFQASSGEGR